MIQCEGSGFNPWYSGGKKKGKESISVGIAQTETQVSLTPACLSFSHLPLISHVFLFAEVFNFFKRSIHFKYNHLVKLRINIELVLSMLIIEI